MITVAPTGIDLHIHSAKSDGMLSPQEIIHNAHKNRLRAISITDHDYFSDFEVIQKLAVKYGIELVPGIELSSRHDDKELHILGYFFDPNSKSICDYVQIVEEKRKYRAFKILERLRKLGIRIPFELVSAKAGTGCIGRPHIARVLVEEGFVFSFQEAFDKYLGEDKPAYVDDIMLPVKKSIQLIKDAHGVAFLAHPVFYYSDKLLKKLLDYGLDGIETYHPRHTESDVRKFHKKILQYNILESGGSDFHSHQVFGSSIGQPFVPYSILDKLKTSITLTGSVNKRG